MKIHSNVLTHDHFADAAHYASKASGGEVWTIREDERGSRSHARAFDVILVGDGTFGRRRTMSGEGIAATWAQWGHFLAALYRIDPNAKAGPYNGADDFHGQTREAFHIDPEPIVVSGLLRGSDGILRVTDRSAELHRLRAEERAARNA